MTDPSVFGPGYWDQTERQPAAEKPARITPRVMYAAYADLPAAVRAAIDGYLDVAKASAPALDAYRAALSAEDDAARAYHNAVKALVALEDAHRAARDAEFDAREAMEKAARRNKVPKRDAERLLRSREEELDPELAQMRAGMRNAQRAAADELRGGKGHA